MRVMQPTKNQQKELDKVKDFFLEAVEPIEDKYIQAIVTAKILSRLGCFADKFVTGKLKYKEVR